MFFLFLLLIFAPPAKTSQLNPIPSSYSLLILRIVDPLITKPRGQVRDRMNVTAGVVPKFVSIDGTKRPNLMAVALARAKYDLVPSVEMR